MDIPLGVNLPDQEASDPYGQSLENVVVSERGIKLRPGYDPIFTLGTSAKVDGLFDWSEQSVIIAVSNGNVYKLTSAAFTPTADSYLLLESGDKLLLQSGDKLLLETESGSVVDVTGGTDMVVGTRVSFANYGNQLFMANGAEIQELWPAASQVSAGSPSHNYTCKKNHTSGATEVKTGTYSKANTTVTVTIVAHGMATGDSATLDFTSGAATDGTYSVTKTGDDTFTVSDTTTKSGTYARTGTTVTVTITAHGLETGASVVADFTTGGGTDGTYTITKTGDNTFTLTDSASGDTSGNVTLTGWGTTGNVSATITKTVTNSNYWTDDGVGSDYDAWVTATRYGSGKAETLEDTDAPDVVKFVAVADKYLLALDDGTENIWFSEVGEPWTWAGEYFAAEQQPDDATVLTAQGGDIWVGGKRTIQVYQNDGSTPWITSNYGAIAHGILAPHSFVFCPTPGTFVWLDDKRRIVKLEGRLAINVNTALNTFIQSMEYVADAIADFLVIDGVAYYLIQFPTAEKSVALNLENNTWAEWYSIHSTIQTRWDGSCMTMVPSWDYTLIGHRSDGTVCELSSNFKLDGTVSITAPIRTPKLHAEKVVRVPELVMHFGKVARSADTANSSVRVKFRDDDNTWSTTRQVTLTDQQNTTHVKHLYQLGHYRRYRQYEIDCSDMWPYALGKMVQK